MKSQLFAGLMLLQLLIPGCSENAASLLDFQKIEYLGNPVLAGLDEIVADMIGENTAIAYAGHYTFITDDNFKTVSGTEVCGCGEAEGSVAYFDFQYIIKFSIKENHTRLQIFESNDFGDHFSSTLNMNEYEIDGVIGGDTYYFSQPFFFGAGDGVMATFKDSSASQPGNNSMVIFGLENSGLNLRSRIAGNYFPLALKFKDDGGYVLASEFSAGFESNYIYENDDYVYSGEAFYAVRSADRAESWNTPSFVTDEEELKGFDFHDNLMMAYSSSAIFRSTDHGENWSRVSNEFAGQIEQLEIVDTNNSFVVVSYDSDAFGLISLLYRSTDGGNSWERMETPVYARKISFYDANHGLAMSENILQATSDGGETWQPIVFPDGPNYEVQAGNE